MRTALLILASLLAFACLAQEQPDATFHLVPDDILQLSVPTRRIVPDDIVQESIDVVRFPQMKSIAVRFTYTEAGAQKMLAFREAHDGRTVRLVIGKFEMRPHQISLNITNYAHWKQGWLKRRTDKVFVQSEQDAEKILEGLKRR